MNAINDEIRGQILALLDRYPSKQAVTLPALHLVHDQYRTVSNAAIVEIAQLLDLHPSQVHDTMSFYEFFKHDENELGKNRFWVCRGLACMLRGAYEVLEHCQTKLGIQCGETTPDQKITLEFAECIGACDYAPACLKNDVHVKNVTIDRVDQVLSELQS
jgi:NADH-quinone oxidoreductase subunit E